MYQLCTLSGHGEAPVRGHTGARDKAARHSMANAQEHPSPAQECAEDVLHEIMEYVENPRDAAACAMVCRNWFSPGRKRLYSPVRVDTSDGEWMSALIHTLIDDAPNTSLCFIRHLHIVYERTLIPHLLSLTIALMAYDFDFADSACIALTSLQGRFVDLSQAPNRNILTLLSTPNLRRVHLDIGSPSQFKNERDVPTSVAWLSVALNSYPGWLRRLAIPSLTQSLTRLDISASVLQNNHTILVAPLRLFARLTHLVLHTDVGGTPLLHEVVGHLPALRALYAGQGTWNAELFDALPKSVHSLWLDAASDIPAKRDLRALAVVCMRPGDLASFEAIAAGARMLFRSYASTPPEVFHEGLLMQPTGDAISVSSA
ncbi:hypothetical protein HDZ31DRAFT_81342 [Schizophyllum fasciatum]